MAYKEPGAYLRVILNAALATGYTPTLIPVIMGDGPKIIKRTDAITRAAVGMVDVLPQEAVAVLSVGLTTSKPTYFQSGTEVGQEKDFKFVSGENKITWEATGSHPDPGDTYFITYTCNVSETQFEPRLVFSSGDVEKYYGEDFLEFEPDVNGAKAKNRLSIGARIALDEGAPVVYVQQVPRNKSTGKATVVEYKDILENQLAFLTDAYKIVPMDTGAEINLAIMSHVELYSSYEERLERTALLAHPKTAEYTDYNDMYTELGGYAASLNYKRAMVPYPDKATKTLSDGNLHELDAPFLLAAYAGRFAFHPVYQSKTRDTFKSFHELLGIRMKRKQKNMLAEKGVMIFEQQGGAGTPISVRHQLTTEMTSPQTREDSIVAISDYTSKYLRSVCEQYIGKYNITGETLARIQATLQGALNRLKKESVINGFSITRIAQDPDEPDTVLVSVRIKVPYPCNYIDITLFLD